MIKYYCDGCGREMTPREAEMGQDIESFMWRASSYSADIVHGIWPPQRDKEKPQPICCDECKATISKIVDKYDAERKDLATKFRDKLKAEIQKARVKNMGSSEAAKFLLNE